MLGLALALVGCSTLQSSNAVTVGASDPVWDPDAIPVLRLTFPEDAWESALDAQLTTDPCADRGYIPADLAYENPQSGETETVAGVGVRYRGHSALAVPNHTDANRWGFRISFDEYAPGRRFHDLEKLTLLGTEGDYSLLRERVGFELMRAAGVPAPRATHVRLYINDVYQGVFPNSEEPDDAAYLEHHFGEDGGSLYKAAGYCHGTDLDYAGDDPASYEGFEAKANTTDADKADDLVPMFACLATGASDDQVRACLSQWLDVDEWLTEMAVDTFLPNIDGMSSTGQNFLIYRPTTTGLFQVYPYDLDLSFYPTAADFASTSIWDLHPTWQASPPVLPARLRTLFAPEYCAKVLEVADQLDPAVFLPQLHDLMQFLAPDMAMDPFIDFAGWNWTVAEVAEVADDRYAAVVAEARACDPTGEGTAR